ncbi:unnamed protein product [Rotaria sordida]|uniref:Uncharacterized protein n=1 Tax=Rotaria sordida TaxID=392033 RepID=A0A815K0B2_9BILA|nr:unnamed protein product [Rotaria sordida]
MHFPSSSTTSSSLSQNQISNITNSNNVLFLPSNTSKMSFIIPNNTNTNNTINNSKFMKILRVLQENNMTESVKTFKKEYETLFNKTTILTITLLSEPYFNTLDGYIAYVQEQPDSSRHEFA